MPMTSFPAVKNSPGPSCYCHQDLSTFLSESSLRSQMRFSGDTIDYSVKFPKIKVEGIDISWEVFQKRFTWKYSHEYYRKFIIERTSKDVYSYLATGAGLVKHHPFKDIFVPIAQLSTSECETLETKASKYSTATSQNTPVDFILQVVSSCTKEKTIWESVLGKIFRVKHPYLKIICNKDSKELGLTKGAVLGIGFQRRGPEPFLPLRSVQGYLNAPDSHAYRLYEKKTVTNIPLSECQAKKTLDFIKAYNKGARFQVLHKNCTSFVASVLKNIGIQVPCRALSFTIVKIVLINFFSRLASRTRLSDSIENISLSVRRIFIGLSGKDSTPPIIIHKASEKKHTLRLPKPSKKCGMFLGIDLPYLLHEWQLEQPSTTRQSKTSTPESHTS